jgi:class 3 adenylate cyclase
MSLSRYAPRLLIKELLDENGPRKPSCRDFRGVVLFVDIVDSTGLTDRFAASGSGGAETLADVLNGYFGGVMDSVDAYGGDTVRIDGDAVIALWPESSECGDPAGCAAAAALAVQHKFRDGRPTEGVALRHRLTVVSGRLRSIRFSDGASRRFFVLAGDPITQLGASALRGDPDEIMVSDAVARSLSAMVQLEKTSSGAHRLVSLGDNISNRHGGYPPTAVAAIADSLVRDFLPSVLVDRTEAGHAAWLAEFRTLSVAYVNLTGLQTKTPDAAQRIEDAVGTIRRSTHPLGVVISDVVSSEKGFIVMIACGLPSSAQENSAARIVEAALGIPPALASIGLGAAIGITTGRAFCGDVGSLRRRQYMTTGPLMSYAARLMQMGDAEIVCDTATARAAAGRLVFSEREFVRVKGRVDLLPMHRVREPRRSRPPFATAPSALYGRQKELDVLIDRLAGLTHGKGGVLAIEAEAGAGKSHLLAHTAQAARMYGYQTITSATSATERTTAYYAFRELLLQLLRLPEGSPAAPGLPREQLAEALRDDPLVAKAALLEDILPLDLPDKGIAQDIVGPARLAGIEDLLVRLAGRLTAISPVVILLDDLHWLDASSAALLAGLARRVPRLLLGVATRPLDDVASVQVRSLLAEALPRVTLPRLRPEAITAIVSKRLGVPTVPANLAAFVQARSEGLPFFAEQLVLALRDQQVLVVERDRCRLSVTDLSEVAVPDTLRDLIVSRIDRLAPDRQLTVKVASAIGRVFEAEMLRHVHPLTLAAEVLHGILGELIGASILEHSADGERPAYAFHHVIIQGVTHDLLTNAQRRPLHRRIAEYLEERHESVLEPHYAELAEHWECGDEAKRAIDYRIKAADLAARRYANEDALNHIGRIDGLAVSGRITLPRRQQAECARIRADACQELTRFLEANKHFKTLAALSGIPFPAGRVRTALSFSGEAGRQALRRFGIIRTTSRAGAQERDRLAAHIHIRFAEHAYFANDTLGLAYGTLASLNRAERAESLPEIVNGCGGLALGLAAVGLQGWARFYRDRSLELAASSGSLPAKGFAELLACVHSFHIGDWRRMSAHSAKGAEIWEGLGDRYRQHCCLVLQGYRLIATGQYAEADRALLTFGEQAEEIESLQVRAWALAARTMLDILLGRSPGWALARLAAVSRADDLHRAERLLCDGIEAALHFEAGSFQEALYAAERGLENLLHSSPAMAGALMFSVPTIGEVLLGLAERPEPAGRSRQALLARAAVACNAVQRFAARNPPCRPRAELLRGRLDAAMGRDRKAAGHWRRAMIVAKQLGMPLEQAASHLALAGLPGSGNDGNEQRRSGKEIMQRLGAVSSIWAHAWGEIPSREPAGRKRVWLDRRSQF